MRSILTIILIVIPHFSGGALSNGQRSKICASPIDLTKLENSFAFKNYPTRSSDGQCYGISALQRRLRVAKFNPSAPKETKDSLKAKLQLLEKGQEVEIGGFANIRALSKSHAALLRAEAEKIQLTMSSASNKTYDRYFKGSSLEPSSAIPKIINAVKKGDNPILYMADGQSHKHGAHAVVVTDIKSNGSNTLITIADPNAPGSVQTVNCRGNRCNSSSTMRGSVKLSVMTDPSAERNVVRLANVKFSNCSQGGSEKGSPSRESDQNRRGSLMSYLMRTAPIDGVYTVCLNW